MATWKRLTYSSSGNPKVDVKMDNVAYIARFTSTYTTLYFTAGAGESSSLASVSVTETPDEIHTAQPLLSL
jgi:hypothetical protein